MLRLLAGPPDAEEDPMAAEYLPVPRWAGSSPDLRSLTIIPLSFRGGLPSSLAEALISTNKRIPTKIA